MFPLMQGAMRRNTRFLITSRDYIWRAAQKDLKLSAMPVLRQSQVVINVEELSTAERAQILYNHLKMGDQSEAFRKAVKDYLPLIAERKDSLPETARRFGSNFFAGRLATNEESVLAFFEKPRTFLLETVSNLSRECRAAIAAVLLNGGKVLSPVSIDILTSAATSFGADPGLTRDQLGALNGSLLLLVEDDVGTFWTYKHPTVSDAFAAYLAGNSELVEMYLRGAHVDLIQREIVCAGISIQGAPLVVPDNLHCLLAQRLESLSSSSLRTFISYRSNRTFSQLMLSSACDRLNQRATRINGLATVRSTQKLAIWLPNQPRAMPIRQLAA